MLRIKVVDDSTLSVIVPHLTEHFLITEKELLGYNGLSDRKEVSTGDVLGVPLSIRFGPLPSWLEAQKSEIIEYVRQCADEVAKKKVDTDILFYNGELQWNPALGANFIDICNASRIKTRRKAMLVLVTNGGDPHAAYRIASFLQQQYDKYTVYLPGQCQSAGTLVAVGAHKIIMSEHGHLGPLDIQISKPDDLRDYASTLDMIKALEFLKDQTYAMFRDTLVNLNAVSSNRITLKTATTVATSLTTELYNPIYAQFEPTKLGEISRLVRVAREYGSRLSDKFKNITENALNQLTDSYPSHAFLINREEAEKLFDRVEKPDDSEKELVDALELLMPGLTRVPRPYAEPTNPDRPVKAILGFLSTPDLTKPTTNPAKQENSKPIPIESGK